MIGRAACHGIHMAIYVLVSACRDRVLRVESILRLSWYADSLSPLPARPFPSICDVSLWIALVDQHYYSIVCSVLRRTATFLYLLEGKVGIISNRLDALVHGQVGVNLDPLAYCIRANFASKFGWIGLGPATRYSALK